MDDSYYKTVEHLGRKVMACTVVLGENDLHGIAAPHIKAAEHLVREAEQHQQWRHSILVPYLQELQEKKRENHDCRQCTHSCGTRHSLYVQEIRNAHSRIWSALYQVRAMAWPHHGGGDQHDVYQLLRETVAGLCDVLTELIDAEEQHFVPSLLTLQKTIHART